MAFSCDATLLNNSACSDFLSKCVRYVSLKKFYQACKYRCRIILAYFKSSRWLADVNAPLRVQCGLDEYMGRLQRRLYNIQRKKLYKENRLSPPSEENKMTISLAIRWRTFKLSAIYKVLRSTSLLPTNSDYSFRTMPGCQDIVVWIGVTSGWRYQSQKNHSRHKNKKYTNTLNTLLLRCLLMQCFPTLLMM